DLGDEAEVAAGVDADTDPRLGQREAGILGGDADVAHERDLETGAKAVTLHRDDDRLGQVDEYVEALVQPPEALVVVAGLLGGGAAGDPVLGHPDVDTGAKRPAFGFEEDGAHPVVEAELLG